MRRILSIVILMSGFSVGTLWAQRTSASLSGTVTDPSGAIVPEAKMQATEISTGAEYTAVANQAGFYVLTNLAPGQYSVEVRKSGFKTIVQMGIILRPDQKASANFSLQVGGTEQTVNVTRHSPAGGYRLVNC